MSGFYICSVNCEAEYNIFCISLMIKVKPHYEKPKTIQSYLRTYHFLRQLLDQIILQTQKVL